MKTGLVLEGGAMRGMFTAGVLDSWMDEQISFDGIVGVSAGALFGINAPAGQKGRAIRYNLKYIRDKRYMGLRSLLTTGNLINADFAFYEVSSKLDIFDEAAFQRSGVDFYAAVTDLHTGAPEYIRITEPFRQMEVLRATSAMPYVSRPVELDGRFYLDGGVSDSIPVHMIGLWSPSEGVTFADYAYLYQLNTETWTIGEALQQIHMVSVGGMAGMMGVHFRYGANVYVADDGTLTLSATERNSVLGSSLATNDWIPAIVN